MAISPPRRKNSTQAPELEKQLRETIQRYELIFKATNDVLYDLDLTTGVVTWNEALYTQYGYAKTKATNTLEWWAGHIHPDDALQLEDKMSAWLEGKTDTWHAEYRFKKADGNYIYVSDRGVVHRDPDGTPLRIIGSFLDITEQKQLARAKDEFISLVSHQLRTPLSAIRIYSEMLENEMFGPMDDNQKMPLRHIADSSVKLIKLVDNILNISRLESGHIVSEPEPHDINALLQEHVNDVMPLAIEKGVTVTFTPDTSIKKVPIDTTILGQVVHNLLTNAIRYSKPGQGIVEVTIAHQNDGYLLSVHDNGIGIPRSARPQIFNRFFRADNTTNLNEHGTGLGLYLIKLMTETTGCNIWFESSRGKGTTFFVHIPAGGMRAG